jgi:hypothetical protein
MLLHEGDMAAPSTPKPARKRAPKPKRPPHLAHGRWLGDLEDEAPLSDAERALVTACGRGEPWEPEGWDGEVPTAATSANTIRASLIRFLLLGGDANHPVHEFGVTAGGVWISGTLDIYQVRCSVRLALYQCRFAESPNLRGATLPELLLRGSAVPGLQAEMLTVIGGCNLSKGFNASGAVRLLRSEIGGYLELSGGTFADPSRVAVNADGLKVKGGLFLRDKFTASGEVRLLGAEIGGDLDCSGSTFVNVGGNALSADGLSVEGALVLRDATVQGAVRLPVAYIGTLIDDMRCWQAGSHILGGLHYNQIIGPTDAASRIAWLKKQQHDHLNSDFLPQPWEQLIKTLREMGHPYDASEVAIAKQDQMRRAGVIRGGVRGAMHWLYGKIAGYGYRPIWTVYWMIWVWLACAFFFQVGGSYGDCQ